MTLEAIWIKPAHRAPMVRVESAELIEGVGIRGNAHRGGRRQVTILDAAAWQRVCDELGSAVDPQMRRANMLVSGVELAGSAGRVLAVGATRILVVGETRPCRLMDDASCGLRAALEPEWRGGVFGQVLTGGVVRTGDRVEWDAAAEESAAI